MSTRSSRVRLAPLAGCLATALALACADASAARTRDTPSLPSWWKLPDPADIARRWQPNQRVPPELPTGTIVVQNCNDHGSGSLRAAVAAAADFGTIDLTQLSCSRITLTTGSITITQSGLTLQGRGSKYLAIDGHDTFPVLTQTSSGGLSVQGLAIEHGLRDVANYSARGGCIYGDRLYLDDTVVAYCTAKTEAASNLYRAIGGGVFGVSSVTLYDSSVVDSSAVAPSSLAGYGGGVASYGSTKVYHSFISGNYANYNGGGVEALGGLVVSYSTFDSNNAANSCGAFCAQGDISIVASTISNNQAAVSVGGADLYAPYHAGPPTIVNSTISGNRAPLFGGLLIARGNGIYGARVANTTIAFNHEDSPTRAAGGLAFYGQSLNGFDLESTIVSNNTYGPDSNPDDVGGGASIVITGANNLVGYSTLPLPGDTILARSAMLAPLAFNGGTTRTHMLLSGSPAIDAGNNAFTETNDQRGAGFPRVIGSAADIGAYELDTDDVIFVNGFDE